MEPAPAAPVEVIEPKFYCQSCGQEISRAAFEAQDARRDRGQPVDCDHCLGRN